MRKGSTNLSHTPHMFMIKGVPTIVKKYIFHHSLAMNQSPLNGSTVWYILHDKEKETATSYSGTASFRETIRRFLSIS